VVDTPSLSDTVCLVTIHGIGFQQAPDDANGIAGYADALHEALRSELGDLLSDDPNRSTPAHVPGQRGVIYVHSSWPPDEAEPAQRSVEKGLERLASRADPRSAAVDTTGKPLFDGSGRIAHVALVYTPAEEAGPDPVAILETATLGLFSIKHYSSLLNEVKLLGTDVKTILHEPHVYGPPAAGNVPRSDAVHRDGIARRVLEHVHGGSPPPAPTGPFEVLRTVEDDVAGYVARNFLRERVQDFVREALIRLCQRGDVMRIVINSHSQGTVLAFDTLRTLPYEVIDKVAVFFTLGSPLRKYAEVLSWGRDAGRLSALPPWAYGERFDWGRAQPVTSIPAWTNLWDQRDPVADPLAPAPPWRRGMSLDPAPPAGLFVDVDFQTGIESNHPLEDILVDNVNHVSGGGLRAHDYWDNTAEVVPRIADRLRQLAPPSRPQGGNG
jgi:hypothetical protein